MKRQLSPRGLHPLLSIMMRITITRMIKFQLGDQIQVPPSATGGRKAASYSPPADLLQLNLIPGARCTPGHNLQTLAFIGGVSEPFCSGN